jgi:hypothetical protein
MPVEYDAWGKAGRLRCYPVTPDEVSEALHHLHPNKDDWTIYERTNMERALYLFWNKRRIKIGRESHEATR